MTKLQKVNELTGTLEDIYPTLIVVAGKNIAIPVDRQHLVKNTDAKVGDIVWITYDDRGYLKEFVLETRGKAEEKKDLWIDSSSQIGKGYVELEAAKVKPISTPLDATIKNYRTPTELRERLIVLQSMCKLGAEVFAITTTPNQMDFDTAMDLIIDRAIHDTETLMKAGGSS
jgi:hypothetical protein